MATKNETPRLHKVLPRIEAPATVGLSSRQAHERLINGYSNVNGSSTVE